MLILLSNDRGVAQNVSARSFAKKHGVFSPKTVHVRFVVDKAALGQVFLSVLRVFPQYHSTKAPYSSSTLCSYQKDKGTKSGIIKKSNLLSEIEEHCTKKVLLFGT